MAFKENLIIHNGKILRKTGKFSARVVDPLGREKGREIFLSEGVSNSRDKGIASVVDKENIDCPKVKYCQGAKISETYSDVCAKNYKACRIYLEADSQ
ncbi:hypothetical protein HNV12_00340 [Methanococcoides sp. SA1]|nr:hypothetical protein [Methanococcoides sp. SA1]